MLIILFSVFLVTLAIGIPIAYGMAISSLIALLTTNVPLTILTQRMFSGVDSFTLMAIPFFMLAGEMMEQGGISRRLVRFAGALVGWMRGGLAAVSVVASIIFAGISGSASADTAAIGSLLIPAQVRKGYPRGYVAALQACAGALGPIIPPSILMIIYGGITGLSIGKLFLAGAVPGLLIGLALMIGNYIMARKYNFEGEGTFSLREIWDGFREAIWALLAPVIIVGGILSGVFTATEAGVIAVVYAFIIGAFVYREIKIKELYGIFLRAASTTTKVMIIVAGASIFGWILAREQFPQIATKLLLSISHDPNVVYFLIIVFLLIIGMFIETVAAAIILIPVLASVATGMGYDPIHFATIVVICLVLGGVTPPVGVLLFITSSIAKTDIIESSRYLMPFLSIIIGVILLITYVPSLVTFLPELLMK
ncbi:MAG: TRAP transporter large permease [Desulfitobacteriaceae bacterium]